MNTTPVITPRRSFARGFAAILMVALTAIFVGWPTRHAPFLSGDDERLILNHYMVNHPSAENAGNLLTQVGDDLYQPLPMISFQIDYALAKPDPTGKFAVDSTTFHRTNMILHSLNAALVFLFLSQLAGCSRVGLFGALLFACHPYAVEPLAWINGRMILLATTFSLFVLLFGIRQKSGNASSTVGLSAAWIASLMSKVVPTVPVVAAWCDHHINGKLDRRRWLTYGSLFIIGIAAAAFAARTTAQNVSIDSAMNETGVIAPWRILLAARYYIENWFWPSRLAAWSSPPTSVVTLDFVITGAEVLAMIGLFFLALRRHPTAALGLGMFAILLIPFLAAGVTRRFLAADRYMYLPVIGLDLALAAIAVSAMDKLKTGFGNPVARFMIGLPVMAILFGCMKWSQHLSESWTDSVHRDQRIVDVYPDAPDARAQLAKAYLFQNDPEGALRVIVEAKKRWPENGRLAGVAGDAFRAKRDLKSAERELRIAAGQLPDHPRTNYQYALTLEDMGRIDEATAVYRKILDKAPAFLPAATSLARMARRSGNLDMAMDYYQRALAINPRHRDSLLSLAEIMIQRQKFPEAKGFLERALRAAPADEQAATDLAIVLTRQGDFAAALQRYDQIIATNTANADAKLNRAALLAMMGRTEEAETSYSKMLSENPANQHAAAGLHHVLQKAHRFTEIVALWKSVEAASAEKSEPRSWRVWAQVLANEPISDRDWADNTYGQDYDAAGFARWAHAFDALLHDRAGNVLTILGEPGEAKLTSRQEDKRRVIVAAIENLKEPMRSSAPALYMLARAVTIDGNYSLAGAVLTQLMATHPTPDWTQAAKKLYMTFPPPTALH